MSNNFLDKDGNVVGPTDFNLTLGRKNAALTRSICLSNEDLAAINAIATALAGSLTVTGTVTANAGTGAATAANQTALNALLPTSLGTKTAANSLAVTLASDGPLTTVSGTTSDAAVANGAAGTLAGYLRAIKDAATSAAPTGASLTTDSIYTSAGTSLIPKFAKIIASASGATTVVAAVASKKLRVLGYNLMGNGAVNAKFQSHVTPTDLTGLHYIAAAGGGICVPFSAVGWFETVAGEALDINLSGAVAVGGTLVYVEL